MRRYASQFAGRSGTHTDGCLTCWRADRFAEVSSEQIDFNSLDLRDNVCLLVLLRQLAQDDSGSQRSKAGSSTAAAGSLPLLLVAQTHLLFNPKRGDIKVNRLHVAYFWGACWGIY